MSGTGKRRFKKRYALALLLVALIAWPILYIELGCSSAAGTTTAYRPLLTQKADQRPEARTLLTYPEWHIVYSAESLGRHLADKPPSGYRYLRDVGSFWSSYCALNRAADPADAGDAKVMLYTIGISFSAEMIVKAGWENTIGRLFEWVGDYDSPEDRHAAGVQQRYGKFMNETPWYQFPFGQAFSGLWRTDFGGVRSFERRIALSLEYGVKTGYAKLIGWASGTALGADETDMRIVLAATPQQVTAIDPRLKILSTGPAGTIVDTPRYAQFTDLAQKIAAAGVPFREIAGNDDIFITIVAPAVKPAGTPLLTMALGDRPGWERRGYRIKVAALSSTIAALPATGATLEHIYDY
ncbi:MAG: hypothetical protein JHD35_04365 [Sphingopyxis sp.]|nr:hypothetical protein [Sphingopyxis sp.]